VLVAEGAGAGDLDCCAKRVGAMRKQKAAARHCFVKVFTRLLFLELLFDLEMPNLIRESNAARSGTDDQNQKPAK
jgi:hypothetical protein